MITAMFALTLLPVLNSLFNPLIYAVRIRYFRVAFIQLFRSRKTFSQAEEFEKKIFGTRQLGVNGNVNIGQGNRSLNSEHEPTGLEEPHHG